jgi:hypothetical protein
VEKYGTARQATDDNIMQRIKDAFACRITKARIQTHTLITLNTYCIITD